MKGIFIYGQLEFRLEVAGEDYCQGDSLACILSVKNHGAAPQTPGELRLDLGEADLKKLKEKKDDALKVTALAVLPAVPEIAPQKQHSVSWTFALDKNCAVSGRERSPCFAYGSGRESAATARLPFTVSPHRHIQKIAGLFESPFQFVIKGQKSTDGRVQIKMKPPTARRLSLVDELVVGFCFEGEALVLEYLFKVKAFETTAASVNVKKGKSEVRQRFEPAQYLLSGGHLNHEFVEGRIKEALSAVETGI